jgi:hypothetical protein
MALKSLVAKKSEIAESVIEEIVSKYVRYYTDTLEVGFTPECASITSERKILVYLVALLGWQYVIDQNPEVSTKPADLEKVLGIPGGSLRPLLKNLKDAHLIAPTAGGGYSVREGNLESIAAIINGAKKTAQRKSAKSPKASKTPQDSGKATKRTSNNPISPKLDTWIADGFFKTPRTLKSVHDRLHEQGVIARQTSVSGPLLKAVKQNRLSRKKITEAGKEVWAYAQPQK